MKIVNDIIETFHCQQELVKNIADSLKITNVKTPHFYITPKVHKKEIYQDNLKQVPLIAILVNFPNLLVTSSNPHAKALPSFVKDTTYFIKKVENVKVYQKTLS